MGNLSTISEDFHWAVVTETSVFIPGDERSRTNPGHGYPETTSTYLEYKSFKTLAALEYFLKKMSPNSRYKVLKVTPVEVELKVSVKANTTRG